MTDNDSTDSLLAKGAELFGIKIRCTHSNVTLCQHVDPEYGWFAAYQCDACGQVTRREVTADNLDTANDAPWLDVAMYEQATTEREPHETLGKALMFFGKAAK